METGRKNKGFTLTELLTTVATIGVLGSLLLPVLAKVKNSAKDTQCFHNQRNLKIGMENAYTDAIPDYNFRYHRTDESEFIRIFVNENLRPLYKDPSIKSSGFYISKPLTCPFAATPGMVRAPFKIVPVKEMEREGGYEADPVLKGVKYFSYTYGLNHYFMKMAVICEKEGIRKTAPLREYFPWLEESMEKKTDFDLYQPVTVDSSLMHPNRSKSGTAYTLGNGAQGWAKFDDYQTVEAVPGQVEKEK